MSVSKQKTRFRTQAPYLIATAFIAMSGFLANYALAHTDIWVVDPFAAPPTTASTQPPNFTSGILRTTAAKGETRSLSFAIRSNEELKQLTIKSTDLLSPTASIQSETVSFRYVRSWFQGESSWENQRLHAKRYQKLVPELLINDPTLVQVDLGTQSNLVRTGENIFKKANTNENHTAQVVLNSDAWNIQDQDSIAPIDLAPNFTQQIWITVSIPDNTAPGVYTGQIQLSAVEHTGLRNIPIELSVLPFELAESHLVYGLYYRGQLVDDPISLSSEFKTAENLTHELTDIKDHGFQYVTMAQGNSNPASRDSLSELRSPHYEDRYIEILRQVGLNNEYFFYNGRGASEALQNTSWLSTFRSKIEEAGFNNLVLFGRDEAHGIELIAQSNDWQRLRASGIKLATSNNKHDLLQHAAAKHINFAILARGLRPNEAIDLRNIGVERVLSYNNPQTAQENPNAYRENYGYSLVRAGYDGAMIYAYQHSFGSIWNDIDHTIFRDHCFTYPTVNGVIGTIAWEGMRAAISDVRYLSTVLSMIEAMPNNSARIEAQRSLDVVYAMINNATFMEPELIREKLAEIATQITTNTE